jgi:hypothetical protein
MPCSSTIVLSAAEFLNVNFFTLRQPKNFCLDNGTVNDRSPYLEFPFFTDCEHFVEDEFSPCVNWPEINFDFLTLRDTILTPAI